MSWIKELDKGLFKDFVLEHYEEWLEEFEEILENRLKTYPKKLHEKLQDRLIEVYNELSTVRGMY